MIAKSILIIMAIECIMCTIAAIWSTVWNEKYVLTTAQYLALNQMKGLDQEPWAWYTYIELFVKVFFTWVLLFTNMVPISLLVTIEVVKFAQSFFIQWDINMYDTVRDMPTRV